MNLISLYYPLPPQTFVISMPPPQAKMETWHACDQDMTLINISKNNKKDLDFSFPMLTQTASCFLPLQLSPHNPCLIAEKKHFRKFWSRLSQHLGPVQRCKTGILRFLLWVEQSWCFVPRYAGVKETDGLIGWREKATKGHVCSAGQTGCFTFFYTVWTTTLYRRINKNTKPARPKSYPWIQYCR